MRFLAVLAMVALSGCALAPKPIAMSETATTIRYDATLYSTADATAEATKACARYGREPKFQAFSGSEIGIRYAMFDCIKRD